MLITLQKETKGAPSRHSKPSYRPALPRIPEPDNGHRTRTFPARSCGGRTLVEGMLSIDSAHSFLSSADGELMILCLGVKCSHHASPALNARTPLSKLWPNVAPSKSTTHRTFKPRSSGGFSASTLKMVLPRIHTERKFKQPLSPQLPSELVLHWSPRTVSILSK